MRRRLSTLLEESLYDRTRQEAVRQGKQISDVVNDALVTYLDSRTPAVGLKGVVEESWGVLAVPARQVRQLLADEPDGENASESRGRGSWEEIRRQFPRQWLLVEAIAAHSSEGRRVLDDIAVLDAFQEAGAALKSYQDVRRSCPQRELYVVHTDRETLDITEVDWLGALTASRSA